MKGKNYIKSNSRKIKQFHHEAGFETCKNDLKSIEDGELKKK